jgi:predicted transcriptional regulator
MADETTSNAANPIELATELTIAWLNNPNVRAQAEDVPAFLKTIHATIGELSNRSDTTSADAAPEYIPAVPVRSSVKPDYIISLIDGRRLKSLKRHLTTHGLTPAEYRERYGLKPDYPMVAPNYSAQRREVAQRLGLGRKGRAAQAATTAPAPAATPKAATPAAAKSAAKPARRTAAKPKASAKPAAKRGPRAQKSETAKS